MSDLNNMKKNKNFKESKYSKPSKSLNNTLNNFLEVEFEDFKESIMKQSKEEIFDKAYEITVKKEIKDMLGNMNLHRAEKEMLILNDNILDNIYKDWLMVDTPLGASMEYSIEDSIENLTKYIGKRFNLSNRKDKER